MHKEKAIKKAGKTSSFFFASQNRFWFCFSNFGSKKRKKEANLRSPLDWRSLCTLKVTVVGEFLHLDFFPNHAHHLILFIYVLGHVNEDRKADVWSRRKADILSGQYRNASTCVYY